MSSTDQGQYNDEISLKEAILTSKDYIAEIKRNIVIIALFTLPFIAYQVYKVFNTELMYEAPLSFMLNEDNGGAGGAISGLLGQIGLPMGGGEDNLDKILELAKSRKICQSTLFQKVNIDNKSDYLANHVIDMLEEKSEWNKRGLFAPEQEYNIDGLRFAHDSFPIFSLEENKALKHLHAHLIGNSEMDIKPLVYNNYNEQSGIMNIISNSFNPEISVSIAKNLYKELSTYYIQKSVEKQESTFKIIQAKTDSIYNELQSKNYRLANFKDKNQSLFARTDQLTETNLMIDIQKLGAMYGEATKNLEIAEFSLKNSTPFIQLIDEPVLPINPKNPSLLKSIILGLILGLFFGIVYVVTRKMIREALA